MDTANILIFEDDNELLTLFLDIMDAFGYQAYGLKEKGKVISAIKEDKYDLLIASIEAAGINFLHTLKKEFPEVPMLVTAAHNSWLKRESLAAGAFGFLLKPFKLNDLEKLIKECINK